ncbi:MAG: hypothetical protein WC995_08730 [Lysobacteraceae bacterium]
MREVFREAAMAEFTINDGDAAGERYFHRTDCPRRPGAGVQWLRFALRADGFFRHSPASHFAIALRARLGFDAAGRPCSISGRGITLGDTSQAVAPADNLHARVGGFGGARGAQVESFWPGGNFLYRQARLLDAGFVDGLTYRVELTVDDQREVGFCLDAETAGGRWRRIGAARVRDRAAHPVEPADGLLIALGRGGGETGPWSVRFSDIQWGWR